MRISILGVVAAMEFGRVRLYGLDGTAVKETDGGYVMGNEASIFELDLNNEGRTTMYTEGGRYINAVQGKVYQNSHPTEWTFEPVDPNPSTRFRITTGNMCLKRKNSRLGIGRCKGHEDEIFILSGDDHPVRSLPGKDSGEEKDFTTIIPQKMKRELLRVCNPPVEDQTPDEPLPFTIQPFQKIRVPRQAEYVHKPEVPVIAEEVPVVKVKIPVVQREISDPDPDPAINRETQARGESYEMELDRPYRERKEREYEDNYEERPEEDYYRRPERRDKYKMPRNNRYRGPKDDRYRGPKDDMYRGPKDDMYEEPERDGYEGPERDDYEGPGRDGYEGPGRDDYGLSERDGYEEPKRDDYEEPGRDDYEEPKRDDYGLSERDDHGLSERDGYEMSRNGRYRRPEYDYEDFEEPNNDWDGIEGENNEEFNRPEYDDENIEEGTGNNAEEMNDYDQDDYEEDAEDEDNYEESEDISGPDEGSHKQKSNDKPENTGTIRNGILELPGISSLKSISEEKGDRSKSRDEDSENLEDVIEKLKLVADQDIISPEHKRKLERIKSVPLNSKGLNCNTFIPGMANMQSSMMQPATCGAMPQYFMQGMPSAISQPFISNQPFLRMPGIMSKPAMQFPMPYG